MAEALGLIASLLTISHIVVAGVRKTRSFLQAAKELENVQEEVEHFTIILREFGDRTVASQSTSVASVLSASKRIIDELDRIIQTKLVKQVNGNARARRKAWSRNKSKIIRLQSELSIQKLNLVIALGARNDMTGARSELILTKLSRDTGALAKGVSDLEERVTTFERNCILKQRTKLQLDSPSPEAALSFAFGESYQRPLVQSSEMVGERLSCPSQESSTTNALAKSPRNAYSQDARSESPEPVSFFELSSQFFPETYTTHRRIPNALVVSYHEVSSTYYTKTNYYEIIHFTSPRRWSPISISIEIHRSSKYWSIAQVTAIPYVSESIFLVQQTVLPRSLLELVYEKLQEASDVSETSHFNLALSSQDTIERMDGNAPSRAQKSISRKLRVSRYDDRALLAVLNDLGVPRIVENEVVQYAGFEPPLRFFSGFRGSLVEEMKVARYPADQNTIYCIQLLHFLGHEPGIPKLIGITTDLSANHLKSYLVELFPKDCMLLMQKSSQPSSKSWAQREKWAYQLIDIVRRVHSKGYVVGTLWFQRPPILVDEYDNIYLCRFISTVNLTTSAGRYFPPEYYRYQKKYYRPIEEKDLPKVSAKFDIFQLGYILWILAESWTGSKTALAWKETFHSPAGPYQDETRTPCTALPVLADSIPRFYRDIVDACRTEHPLSRPAAHELLAMFPDAYGSQSAGLCRQQPEFNLVHDLDQQSLLDCRVRTHSCDICHRHIFHLFYHCKICNTADYDVCEECFKAGAHCLDGTHLLAKVVNGTEFAIAERYYSSVELGMNGTRNVVEV